MCAFFVFVVLCFFFFFFFFFFLFFFTFRIFISKQRTTITLIIENPFGNIHNPVAAKWEDFHLLTANPLFLRSQT